MKKAFIYSLILLFVYLFIPLSQAVAAGEFQADYNVSYSVTPSGSTIVTQQVTLTNNQTNLYPKQYSIVIDTDKITDVIARDDNGVIIPQVNQTNGKTSILLTFNQQVVGIGRKLTFTLRFQNQAVASHNGSIWEINIPGVSPDPDLASYNVMLDVPNSFGPTAYLYPLPADGRKWTKDQMLKGGISAAYGLKQIFNLDLSYFLENSKVTPVETEIALPPDTAFQKVQITSLKPQPIKIVRDNDGNWLARYLLLPGAQTKIIAKAIVETYFNPRPGVIETLADPSIYLKPQPYWESDNPKIIALAKENTTVRAIYDFVVRTLTYDYRLVNQNPVRKGALAALNSPNESICTEFTDLFVAMARAAGIPARAEVGYAYTTNSKLRPLSLVADVLHTWPEYYDRTHNLWVPVDPTWGNTTGGVDYFDKLDFDHIVFAIEGVQSNYPYPAGFYREAGTGGKNVKVTFGTQEIVSSQANLLINFNFPLQVTSGFTASGSVTFQNTSGRSVDSAKISIETSPFPFSLTKVETNIPPYAKLEYPLSLKIAGFILKGTGQIKATVNGQTENFFFSIQPLYWLLVPIAVLFSGLFLLSYLIFVKLHVWKSRKP